jgi:CBS domain-containing protein
VAGEFHNNFNSRLVSLTGQRAWSRTRLTRLQAAKKLECWSIPMNIRDIMTSNPACCVPEDTAQTVAKMMCDSNVGSIPVVTDRQSKKLAGIITDRDLCCSVVAKGLDPAMTSIREYMRTNPVACRPTEDVESCERAMQKHQIRRIPVVDQNGCCIGIVSQADIALKHEPSHLSRTVTEISRSRAVPAYH